MRKLALALCLTALAACGTVPQTQQHFTQACTAYDAAFSTVLSLRQAGKLSQAQIDQVTTISHQITPLCTGPMPTDPTAAETQVLTAVTTLTIMETVK